MRIAIYGGAFDPPTYGHKYVVQYLLDTRIADRVFIVPCGDHTFKKNLTPFKLRYEMCKALFKEFLDVQGVSIHSLAYEENLSSDTYTLMERMKKDVKNDYLFFVVGSDNVNDMKNWINSEKLLSTHPFVVIPRNNNYVSSTDVRNAVAEGNLDPCDTDPSVLDIIEANSLYGCPGEPVWEGKFLTMMRRNNWEFVHRKQMTVSVGALDLAGRMIFVRQRREPMGCDTIELPSGLVDPGEAPWEAAYRELLEETGYKAPEPREDCVPETGITFCKSPGLTDEKVQFYIVHNCDKIAEPERGISVIATFNPLNNLLALSKSGCSIGSSAWLLANIYDRDKSLGGVIC